MQREQTATAASYAVRLEANIDFVLMKWERIELRSKNLTELCVWQPVDLSSFLRRFQ
ncbi:hypothetical protein CC79DRAFT_1333735 [Sarocladium strictum]